MRKFDSYRRVMLSLTVVGMLAAACDDNDEIAVDPNAEFDVVLDVPSETNEDVTVTSSQGSITAKVHFTSTDKSMKRLYITENVGGQGEEIYEPKEDIDLKADGSIDLTGKNDEDFEFQFELPVPSGITAGTVVYKFWTTTGNGDFRDVNQRLAVGPATITLVYGSGTNEEADVKTYNDLTLAAPLGDGSSETFVSLLDGEIYRIDQGVEFVSYWDFGYVYLMGEDKHATLTSSYDYLTEVVNIPVVASTTKEELNKTYFATTTMSSEDFDAVDESDDLANLAVSNQSAQTVSFLEVGDVVAFQTQYGKKGLIRIDDIAPGNGSDDWMKIDIKVQP
ncbi:hypothetical protein [Dawidia soli]|uniref:Uncharacterized protein n=1 Tax=Dawidia soli TaxID=2782352 RepID=A0AAP2GJC7_9BACT|nr:hypothetical protein [Dawidia soli]MBT1689271.1 hypothetical protein [Dawidia soli]